MIFLINFDFNFDKTTTMPKIEATIFKALDLTAEQQELLANLEGGIQELITDGADLHVLKTAYDEYIVACFEYQQYENAEAALNFISDNSTELDLSDADTADLYHRFGVLAFTKKDFETAKNQFEKALELIGDDEPFELKGKVLCDLGNVAAVNEAFEEATALYEAAIEVNEEHEIESVKPFFNLGLVYFEQGDEGTSIEYFETALEMLEEDEELELQEFAHLQLGAIYYSQNNLKKSLLNYHYASELQDEEAENAGKTYVAMVAILLQMGENAKAIEFYEKALPNLMANGTLETSAEHYFQLANLYTEHQQAYQQAIDYYQKSLDLVNQDEQNDEWRNLMVAKLEDSIESNKELLNKADLKKSKKSSFFGRLLGK